VPEYIFSYKGFSPTLHRLALLTGEKTSFKISRRFFDATIFCELPGNNLLFTGGVDLNCWTKRDCWNLNVTKEFSVVNKAPMLSARAGHCLVYFQGCVLAIGGLNTSKQIDNCERYLCSDNRWEPFDPLPRACGLMCAAVIEEANRVFVIGGSSFRGESYDFIQRLRLDELTWDLLEVKLPVPKQKIASFKVDEASIFVVLNKDLYEFKPGANSIVKLKQLSAYVEAYCGPNYFSNGVLYTSNTHGSPLQYSIGSLEIANA